MFKKCLSSATFLQTDSTAMECQVSFINYSSNLAKELELKLRGLHFCVDKPIM